MNSDVFTGIEYRYPAMPVVGSPASAYAVALLPPLPTVSTDKDGNPVIAQPPQRFFLQNGQVMAREGSVFTANENINFQLVLMANNEVADSETVSFTVSDGPDII